MDTNDLLALKELGCYPQQRTGQLTQQVAASNMLMQQFTQILEDLNRKVDSLAVTNSQLPQFVPPQAKPVRSIEVESSPVESPQPNRNRQVRVNRSKLLDMFD